MSRPGGRHVIGGAIAVAACAACCAAPVVGFLGVAGLAAIVLTLAFAGVVFAAVVGLTTTVALIVSRARRRRATCATPTPGEMVPLELGATRTEDG